ncbi:MAG: Family ership [Actinomycetota bacterium]|jgi:Ca-activated chloride channel family protein
MPQMDIRTDRSLASATTGSSHFVVVQVTARPQALHSERAGLDLGIALDRSGSMTGTKIDLAREGVATSIRMLRSTDRFALSTFDHRVEVPFETSFATPMDKERAFSVIRRIQAGGSTDLFTGYLKAAQQVGFDMREDRLTRVLVITDGHTNHGVTDPNEIVEHVRQLRLRGLITSTIGLGSDFNEVLLTRMASAGGGNSYYVEHPQQLSDVLTGEVGDALQVTERDVVLEVRVPKGTHVEPMDASRLTVVPGGLKVRLGDLVSEQMVRVVFEVRVPKSSKSPSTELEFVLSHADSTEPLRQHVAFQYANELEYHRQAVDRSILQGVYATYSARARRSAAELNAECNFEEARTVMRQAHDRLRDLAQGDPLASTYLDALEQDIDLHGRAMEAQESKRRRYEAEHRLRDRDQDGRPRRWDGA